MMLLSESLSLTAFTSTVQLVRESDTADITCGKILDLLISRWVRRLFLLELPAALTVRSSATGDLHPKSKGEWPDGVDHHPRLMTGIRLAGVLVGDSAPFGGHLPCRLLGSREKKRKGET